MNFGHTVMNCFDIEILFMRKYQYLNGNRASELSFGHFTITFSYDKQRDVKQIERNDLNLWYINQIDEAWFLEQRANYEIGR